MLSLARKNLFEQPLRFSFSILGATVDRQETPQQAGLGLLIDPQRAARRRHPEEELGH